MKKTIFALAISLPVLFACEGSKGGATFEEPKTAESATSVNFNRTPDTPVIVVNTETVTLKEVEFFRSGRYLMTAEAAVPKSKAVDLSLRYFSGTYTFSNGSYQLSGDYKGTIKLTGTGSSASVEIDGETYEANATPATVKDGSLESNVYRSWRPSAFKVSATAPSTPLGTVEFQVKQFSGTKNVSEIVRIFSEDAGLKFDTSVFQGFDIDAITLNPGKLMIRFTNGKTFGGNLSMSGNNFTYDLSSIMQNDLFNGKASGTITIDGDKANVSVNVDTKNSKGETVVKGTATLILSEVK